MADDDDSLLQRAKNAFDRCADAEAHNRATALDDIAFAMLEDQWPAGIRKQRELEGRPILTINKLKGFVRQVVNDSRQNKPTIKVHPADSRADPKTADVISGLIRNIEYTSNADVAYDTAVECAVAGGFGYWRIGIDYAHDDNFDLDITINRVANPFSVYGDPNSRAADSSDWNIAFVTDRMAKAEYEREYGDVAKVDWDDSVAWSGLTTGDWRDDEGGTILVAEYWTREEIERSIVRMTNGMVFDEAMLTQDPDIAMQVAAGVLVPNSQRKTKSHRVKQCIMNGVEILKETEWPGRYIPIIPVYGEEFDVQGKRYFRSLVHSALDAQRMFNYWRSTSTELVALAPRVPFIGPVGAFDDDPNWSTANKVSHPFLEYSGGIPPMRQPLDTGGAAGALQEAMNASDDMKAITGLYDASLGARSNETSGRAIMARQREGDVATFHFIDNLSRAIRHTGRVIIDLIPKVYDTERVLRVLGEDGQPATQPVNQQFPAVDPKTGQPMQQPVMGPNGQPMVDPATQQPLMQPIMAMHDLSAGKYDLTVRTGPSFTSRREEAAMQMTEMIRSFPQAAPIVMPEMAKNLDWPGADKIAEKLQAQADGQVPPQAQQQMQGLQKQVQDLQKQLQQLSQENQGLKMDQQSEQAKIQSEAQLDQAKLQSQMQLDQAKMQADEQRAAMKVQSDERIAAMKIESDERIAMMRQRAAMQPAMPTPFNQPIPGVI